MVTRSSPRRRGHRLVVGAVVVLGVLALTASPASADPPAPTDYRSSVDVESTAAARAVGVDAAIVGGDGFLLLEVDDGVAVEVPGYAGDPYLRFQVDGTVQENQSSPTTYLNQTRTRTDDGGTDPDADPVWKTVATDGRWAWHDHRIHYMGGGVPEAARSDTGVRWSVPLVVDGEDLALEGSYRILDAPTPLPWLALALVVALAVALGLTRLMSPLTASGVALLAVGIGGVVAGVAQRGASPPGAPTSPLVVALPAIALVAGVIAVMQRGRVLRAVAALAGAAAAGGWAVVRISVLWKAILPTSLAAPTDRLLTALAIGGAVGAAVAVVRSGALAPDLDDDGPTDLGPVTGSTVAAAEGAEQ